MPRVLHLCDFDADYQTRVAISLLTKNQAHDVRTLGRGGDFTTPFIGFLKIRAVAKDFDTVHAWGGAALLLAAATASRRVIYSPALFPNRQDLRWLRAISAYRDITVVCPTQTMRRYLVRHGVPPDRTTLVVPGVDSSRLKKKRDESVRARLGIDPDDYVIFAAGESMHGANHHAAILTLCVLNVYQKRHKLLLWGRGPQAQKEIDYCDLMWPVSFAKIATRRIHPEVELEDFLPAADAVLVTAEGPIPTLPIAVCMAAGLPIVAAVTSTVSELLEDRRNALLTGECRSRKLAKRFLELHDDPKLAWSICDGARADAYQLFSATRFLEQMEAVYRPAAASRTTQANSLVGAAASTAASGLSTA